MGSFIRIGTSNVPAAYAGRNFTFDASDAVRGMNLLDTRIKSAVDDGLADATKALALDVLEQDPKAPELTSALRSGIAVFVGRVRTWTSIEFRKPAHFVQRGKQGAGGSLVARPVADYLPASNDETAAPGVHEGTMVVNAPYATYQHEVHHRGYVSEKLWRNGLAYGSIIAGRIARVLR